jgi:hypothetical protein
MIRLVSRIKTIDCETFRPITEVVLEISMEKF